MKMYTHVALVELVAWLPAKLPAIDTGASRSMDAIVKSVDGYVFSCDVDDVAGCDKKLL